MSKKIVYFHINPITNEVFYVLYAVWSIKYGYKNNPFEVEAFNNDDNLDYLLSRKRYNYFK